MLVESIRSAANLGRHFAVDPGLLKELDRSDMSEWLSLQRSDAVLIAEYYLKLCHLAARSDVAVEAPLDAFSSKLTDGGYPLWVGQRLAVLRRSVTGLSKLRMAAHEREGIGRDAGLTTPDRVTWAPAHFIAPDFVDSVTELDSDSEAWSVVRRFAELVLATHSYVYCHWVLSQPPPTPVDCNHQRSLLLEVGRAFELMLRYSPAVALACANLIGENLGWHVACWRRDCRREFLPAGLLEELPTMVGIVDVEMVATTALLDVVLATIEPPSLTPLASTSEIRDEFHRIVHGTSNASDAMFPEDPSDFICWDDSDEWPRSFGDVIRCLRWHTLDALSTGRFGRLSERDQLNQWSAVVDASGRRALVWTPPTSPPMIRRNAAFVELATQAWRRAPNTTWSLLAGALRHEGIERLGHDELVAMDRFIEVSGDRTVRATMKRLRNTTGKALAVEVLYEVITGGIPILHAHGGLVLGRVVSEVMVEALWYATQRTEER